MFGGSLAAGITAAVALMTDTLLAGVFFNKLAIAAVAVGTPIINIFQALNQTIINGASVKMNVAAGKGDNEEVRKSYSVAVSCSVATGVLFILVCQIFAKPLVMAFGGTPEIAETAIWYLRGATGCILFGTINMFASKTLALFGRQKVIFTSALIAIVGNIVFSMFLVKVLPARFAIAGLGVGTWLGGFLAFIASSLALRKHNISYRFGLKDISLERFGTFVRLGIPSSGNNLADGVVSGVANNLIVNGFSNGVVALSVYTAVKSIATFATAIVQAINLAVTPLFGIMYGSRDKNGLMRAYRESLRLATIANFICGVAVSLASPLLAGVFDMKGSSEFTIGLIISMFLFLPLTSLARLSAQFFEAVEKPVMGLLYSVVPDSVIYPLLLLVLVPVLGYNGIWLSFSLNPIPFLVGLYLIRSARDKNFSLSANRIFCIDGDIRENVPKIDISIESDNRDVSFVSEQVYDFLMKEEVGHKIAHTTALCLEELAADFVEHTTQTDEKDGDKVIMDIKLFSDADKLRTIIRNKAECYNPLNFVADPETFHKIGVKLAQKLAKRIEYNYVYQMNVVTIDIDKKV